MYGPNPSKHEQRAIKKKIARVAESQNAMAEALSLGNLDQVGRTAWSNMVDLCQEMVVDEINDALEELSDEKANGYWQKIQDNEEEMRLIREAKKMTDADLTRIDPHYRNLKADLEKNAKDLELSVNSLTYPQLCNKSVPKYIYSETFNNRWDICHGYITTDITDDEMEAFYETAVEDKDTEVEINDKERRHKKEAMRTISDVFDSPCYYTCSGKPGYTCPQPNQKKTPDIVVTILPDDPTTYLKIPVYVWEVIGMKKITEKGKREFPGIVAALQGLATSPYTYYTEVDAKSVKFFKLERIADEGRIKITVEKITFAKSDSGQLSFAFGKIFERLTEIFVDTFVNLTWIKHECSRLMKSADYRDFIANRDGRHERGIEMHCWHFFETRYFGQNRIDDPVEYYPGVDKCDPAIPAANRAKKITDMEYKVPGDELVPPLSSDTEVAEIPAVHNALVLGHQRAGVDKIEMLAVTVSRAVRNPFNGFRCNPFHNTPWNRSFNQWRSNVSLHMTDKVPEFAGLLRHTQFDTLFNARLKQPPVSERKTLEWMQPDPEGAADYTDTSSDEDDDDKPPRKKVLDISALLRHHPTVTPQASPTLPGITPAIVGRGHAAALDYPTLARPPTTPVSGKCIFKLPKYIAMIRFTGFIRGYVIRVYVICV